MRTASLLGGPRSLDEVAIGALGAHLEEHRDRAAWEESMTIAVLGAGNVGKALGEALAAKGHDVVYGVRTPKRSESKIAARFPRR